MMMMMMMMDDNDDDDDDDAIWCSISIDIAMTIDIYYDDCDELIQ